MDKLSKNSVLLLVLIVSIIALISAYFIQYVLGHQPCNLCLIERVPYVLAIIIIFLTYNFGIEQGFIQESLVCDLQGGSKVLSKEELLLELQNKTVSCKDVTFKLFGLSLTTFNIFISITIVLILTKIFLDYEKNK
jgi:disulfide bond formation protein DsbB